MVLLALILAATLLFGCAQQAQEPAKPTPPATSATPTSAEPGKDSIKIGFTISLSGPGAGAGTEQYRAYEVWKEWVNSKGGIYVKEYNKKLPVEFVYYDDATEPARAKSLYEKLVLEDKVDLLLAPWGTFIHLAIVPVIEKYRIPVIGNTAGVEQAKINELQTKYEFFTYPTPKTSAMAYTLFLGNLGVKKIALLYAQTDFTVANAKWNKKFIEDKKFAEVVVYEGYPLGSTDLKGLLLKVKEANPDAVVVHSYPADAILVTSQMKELDINPKVFVLGVGGQILAFDQKFDEKTKEGIVALNTWHPDFYSEAAELYDLYIQKYGHNPPSHALGLAWVSCLTLQMAIEKAGTLDPVKIRETLATETFETPFGEVKFENQVNTKALTVFDQWQNGELKPIFVFKGVYPNVELAKEFKTTKMEYPKPNWPK
jgi:branched-chain amino acid transport system substrate-binding protein